MPKFPKFWQHADNEPPPDPAPVGYSPNVVVQLDTDDLRAMSAVFSAPRWLRNLGVASWLLVGAALLVVGLTWVLGMTQTIVGPVLCGGVIAVVCAPAV